MRPAAAHAAMRRGSSTRIFRPWSQLSSIKTSGTRVVLPAPGGATRTADARAVKAVHNSFRPASIGSGVANFMAAVSGGQLGFASAFFPRHILMRMGRGLRPAGTSSSTSRPTPTDAAARVRDSPARPGSLGLNRGDLYPAACVLTQLGHAAEESVQEHAIAIAIDASRCLTCGVTRRSTPADLRGKGLHMFPEASFSRRHHCSN